MARPRQKVSIFTLASEFDVSAPTISKALSNSTEVSEAMRRRIRRRADELNFRPTRPRRKVQNICALLDFEFIDHFSISGYAEAVVQGVYAFCRESGAEFSIYGETTASLERQDLVKELHLRNADGAVIIGAHAARTYFGNLEKSRFPFHAVYDGPEKATVTVDNHRAGELACAHLVEAGFRKLAVARHMDGRTASSARFLGFVQEAARHPLLEHVVELIPDKLGGPSWGRSLFHQWLERKRPYDALFCLAENVATGVLSAAAEKGVRIPGDLGVLTCDDLSVCAEAAPPLSVVDIPNQRAGYLAAAMVWGQLTGEWDKLPEQSLDAPLAVERVIARHSTRKLS